MQIKEKELIETMAEEIENLYGKETELTKTAREYINFESDKFSERKKEDINMLSICRGKRIDNKEWVIGFYFSMVHEDGRHIHHFIMPFGTDISLGTPIENIQVEIIPETVCQHTGFLDKNVNFIFHGDIIKFYNNCERPQDYVIGVIKWNIKCASFQVEIDGHYYTINNNCKYEVIGNIFDNPELLKKVEKCI